MLAEFSVALKDVMQNLAKQIVMDGEGAQKFITVNVHGGERKKTAKIVAKAIANSPLVKTAIAGCDPNWGRIAMAVGKTHLLGMCPNYQRESTILVVPCYSLPTTTSI